MKANALYHLMQLRARKLQEHITPEYKDILTKFQDSLHVNRESGSYILTWKDNSENHSINIDNDRFKFYIKGDSKKASSRNKSNTDYRTFNWKSALEVWKEIFKTSNLDPEVLIDDGALSFGIFVEDKKKFSVIENSVVAFLLATISALIFSFNQSIQVLFSSFFLITFACNFGMVHLRNKLNYFEKFLVGSGALLPIYFGGEPFLAIPILLGLHLISYAEQKSENNHSIYFAGGVPFGIGALYSTYFTSVTFLTLISLFIILSFIDKKRIKAISIIWIAFGFIAIFISISIMHYYDFLSIYTPSPAEHNVELLFKLALVISSSLFIGFALWWITGIQYYFSPWLSLLSLAIASTVTLFNNVNYEWSIITILAGFVVFIIARIIRSFIATNFVRDNTAS